MPLFIDYVTLMLINMAAGLFILAWYVYRGLDDPEQGKWVPAFAITGFIALMNGFRMTWIWPLPGSYNAAYGDTSVLFGSVFIAAAIAMWGRWSLIPVAIYAFFAGVAGVLVGIRIMGLGLTAAPYFSGAGFILTGLAGVFALPTLYLRKVHLIRAIGAIVVVIAALIWSVTGYMGYWMHLSGLAKWMPR